MSPDRVPPTLVFPLTGSLDRRGDRSIPQVPTPETTRRRETTVMVPTAAAIAVIALPLVLIWDGPGLLDAVAAFIALAAARGSHLRWHCLHIG
jgi:hypothetical protein